MWTAEADCELVMAVAGAAAKAAPVVRPRVATLTDATTAAETKRFGLASRKLVNLLPFGKACAAGAAHVVLGQSAPCSSTSTDRRARTSRQGVTVTCSFTP